MGNDYIDPLLGKDFLHFSSLGHVDKTLNDSAVGLDRLIPPRRIQPLVGAECLDVQVNDKDFEEIHTEKPAT